MPSEPEKLASTAVLGGWWPAHADAAATAAPAAESVADALRLWLKPGFISFGGPASQIAFTHNAWVERRRIMCGQRRSPGAVCGHGAGYGPGAPQGARPKPKEQDLSLIHI